MALALGVDLAMVMTLVVVMVMGMVPAKILTIPKDIAMGIAMAREMIPALVMVE